MNRRRFLNRGFALTAGGIFVPRILKAQLGDPAFVSSLTHPAAAAGGGYTPNAVTFNGSSYIVRSTNFTGKADSSLLLFSFWLKLGATGVTQGIWTTRNNGGRVVLLNTNKIQLNFRGVVSNPSLVFTATNAFPNDASWHHIACSFNTSNASNRHIYMDASPLDGSWTTYVNEALDLDSAPESVGAYGTGINPITGCLSEVYWTTEYLDLSVSSNLEKFILGGSPVDLGSDGSLPTGTAPLCYCRSNAASYLTNSGSGGNFSSVTGSLSDCSPPP